MKKNQKQKTEKQITGNILESRKTMKEIFKDCGDIVFRDFTAGAHIPLFLVFTDNMVNSASIEESILNNVMNRCREEEAEGLLPVLTEQVISGFDVQKAETFEKAAEGVLSGDTLIFMEGSNYALRASTKSFPNRGVSKAETEVVVQGPKDAFTELLAFNLVLIRRRIQDVRLKVKRKKVGTIGKNDAAIMYLSHLVRPDMLAKVEKQLENLQLNGILDTGTAEQLLEKHRMSPFPQLQMTERPDKAAAALMEGRIVVLLDNSPFVILLPATLNLFFQAAEDYYERWEIMSFIRILRYVAAFFAVALPGLYIALSVYHPSLLPTALAVQIAKTRLHIPFSVVSEVVVMELAFELLREAGIRLPSPVSSTIGIVGGIIIGSAAVEAGLVSPAVVIISALTGICTFVIPNSAIVSGLRLSKYGIILLSSLFGLFGFWVGLLFLLVHLSGLSSYGIPYLYPFCSATVNDDKDLADSIIRLPLRKINNHSIFGKRKEKKGGEV